MQIFIFIIFYKRSESDPSMHHTTIMDVANDNFSCTCGIPQIFKRRCKHMLAMQLKRRDSCPVTYTPETFFLQSYYQDQYLPFVHDIENAVKNSQFSWKSSLRNSNNAAHTHLKEAPLFKRSKGRRRYNIFDQKSMKRIRGKRSNTGKQVKCSLCNTLGHNKAGCKSGEVDERDITLLVTSESC